MGNKKVAEHFNVEQINGFIHEFHHLFTERFYKLVKVTLSLKSKPHSEDNRIFACCIRVTDIFLLARICASIQGLAEIFEPVMLE